MLHKKRLITKNQKCEIFNIICDMCDLLENNFTEFINDFNQKYKMTFKLRELFNDIFWDCVFHIKIL